MIINGKKILIESRLYYYMAISFAIYFLCFLKGIEGNYGFNDSIFKTDNLSLHENGAKSEPMLRNLSSNLLKSRLKKPTLVLTLNLKPFAHPKFSEPKSIPDEQISASINELTLATYSNSSLIPKKPYVLLERIKNARKLSENQQKSHYGMKTNETDENSTTIRPTKLIDTNKDMTKVGGHLQHNFRNITLSVIQNNFPEHKLHASSSPHLENLQNFDNSSDDSTEKSHLSTIPTQLDKNGESSEIQSETRYVTAEQLGGNRPTLTPFHFTTSTTLVPTTLKQEHSRKKERKRGEKKSNSPHNHSYAPTQNPITIAHNEDDLDGEDFHDFRAALSEFGSKVGAKSNGDKNIYQNSPTPKINRTPSTQPPKIPSSYPNNDNNRVNQKPLPTTASRRRKNSFSALKSSQNEKVKESDAESDNLPFYKEPGGIFEQHSNTNGENEVNTAFADKGPGVKYAPKAPSAQSSYSNNRNQYNPPQHQNVPQFLTVTQQPIYLTSVPVQPIIQQPPQYTPYPVQNYYSPTPQINYQPQSQPPSRQYYQNNQNSHIIPPAPQNPAYAPQHNLPPQNQAHYNNHHPQIPHQIQNQNIRNRPNVPQVPIAPNIQNSYQNQPNGIKTPEEPVIHFYDPPPPRNDPASDYFYGSPQAKDNRAKNKKIVKNSDDEEDEEEVDEEENNKKRGSKNKKSKSKKYSAPPKRRGQRDEEDDESEENYENDNKRKNNRGSYDSSPPKRPSKNRKPSYENHDYDSDPNEHIDDYRNTNGDSINDNGGRRENNYDQRRPPAPRPISDFTPSQEIHPNFDHPNIDFPKRLPPQDDYRPARIGPHDNFSPTQGRNRPTNDFSQNAPKLDPIYTRPIHQYDQEAKEHEESNDENIRKNIEGTREEVPDFQPEDFGPEFGPPSSFSHDNFGLPPQQNERHNDIGQPELDDFGQRREQRPREDDNRGRERNRPSNENHEEEEEEPSPQREREAPEEQEENREERRPQNENENDEEEEEPEEEKEKEKSQDDEEEEEEESPQDSQKGKNEEEEEEEEDDGKKGKKKPPPEKPSQEKSGNIDDDISGIENEFGFFSPPSPGFGDGLIQDEPGQPHPGFVQSGHGQPHPGFVQNAPHGKPHPSFTTGRR